MNNSQVSHGIHKELADSSLDGETVKLLKTQDIGYLNHKVSIDMRKAERLKGELHIIGDRNPRVHRTFVESSQELQNFDLVSHFDTVPELVERSFNRPRLSTLEKGVLLNGSTRKDLVKVQKLTAESYKELNRRVRRAKQLRNTAKAIELQKHLMGKGTKKKIQEGEDGKVPIFKWKRQRTK
jgi:U3 small nucleolar RNA-associated protein 11